MGDKRGLSSRAVSGLFMEAFTRLSMRSFHEELAWKNTGSVQDTEVYRNPVDTGSMEEFTTELKLNDGTVLEYSLRNREYADALSIDRRQLEFDQTGTIRIQIAQKAERAAMHPNLLLSDLINAGDAAASLGQDGKVFFATNHLQGKSGTQSNKITSPAATPSSPTSAEVAGAVNAMLGKITTNKDEAGFPVNMGARQFLFMYPSAWAGVAVSAISSDLMVAGAVMLSNPLGALQVGAPGRLPITIIPVCNPLLTSAIKGFLFRLDGEIIRPFVWQERVPTMIEELTAGSDEAVLRNRYIFAIKANRAVGYMQWRHAVQVTMV